MNRFFKTVTYPFRKIDAGVSKLVDKISPSKQEKITASRPYVWLATVTGSITCLFAAPTAIPPLVGVYFTYDYAASHCRAKINTRKAAQDKLSAPADAVDSGTASSQPSSPAPDFKAAAEKNDVTPTEKPVEPQQPPRP